MKNYLKSLFPTRWIILAIFIFLSTILLCLLNIHSDNVTIPNYYHIINIIFWFIIDFSIGLGREEKNIWKNLLGIGVTMIILILLIFKMKFLELL